MDATIEKLIEKRDKLACDAMRYEMSDELFFELGGLICTLDAVIAFLQGDQNALDRI